MATNAAEGPQYQWRLQVFQGRRLLGVLQQPGHQGEMTGRHLFMAPMQEQGLSIQSHMAANSTPPHCCKTLGVYNHESFECRRLASDV